MQVGIGAAIVANHQVCVRHLEPDGRARTERFHVPPTLAGLSALSRRLSSLPDVTAVAGPTSMTWLPLALALLEAGGRGERLELLETQVDVLLRTTRILVEALSTLAEAQETVLTEEACEHGAKVNRAADTTHTLLLTLPEYS